ncbi:adenylate/guanylate cyclase domain-containing protein [Shimia biformata]|uniref:adenylate/guanylate cyclase domain-containing protein n=1 Tax=Shimia biformata TaxID=1294299 RepID=UPI001951565F|nr:adenylate/guanylate cyclase domain-containing protein [Shimia biformata]
MTIATSRSNNSEPARALAAVLFADLVSFTRHVSRSEQETLDYVESCMSVFESQSHPFRGEFIKSMGDGVMLVFGSARDAIGYAETILDQFERTRPDGADYAFRFGIHLGDVRRSNGDAFGHTVNVAARLENEAPPGGICVSEAVVSAVGTSGDWRFTARGVRKLRNLPEPMALYTLVRGGVPSGTRTAPAIRISLLGGLALSINGHPVTLPVDHNLHMALCYLAMSPTWSAALDKLSAFAETPPGTPRTGASRKRAMTQALNALGRVLGAGLIVDDGYVRLDGALVGVDLTDLESSLRNGVVDPILLEDHGWTESVALGAGGGRTFSNWLAVARTDWHDRIARELERQLAGAEAAGNPLAGELSEALLIAEPGHEQAARSRMQFLHKSGNPAGAVRVYENLADIMRSRYGIEPKPETRLIALGGGTTPARVRSPGGKPLRLQLAYFTASTPSAEAPLEDFRTALMSGLACFRGWAVVEIPQNTDTVPGSDYTLSAAASVADSGGGFDLTLTLGNAQDGAMLWSERFSIDGDNMSDSIRRAVGRIAATLEVYIATDRVGRSFGTGPSDGKIVDVWLKGERLIARWTPESHDEAREIFEDIIQRAPRFAPAYASLASIYNGWHILHPGAPRDRDLSRRAHDLAETAVELDPLDARNRLAAAWAAAMDQAFDVAFMNMDIAERLNPHSPRCLISCAMGFSFLGEHGRAIAALARSLEVSPVLLDYQWCYAATVHYLAGEPEAALEAALKSGDRIFDNLGWTAAAFARLGRVGEASSACTDLIRRMEPIWRGETPLGPRAVVEWFGHAYPIRRDEDREALTLALNDAMRGLNMPG